MFVLTLGKKSLRRIGAVAVCGIVLAGTVFAVGSFFKEGDSLAVNGQTTETEQTVTSMKIENSDSIAAFFKNFGLEVDLSTATVDKVKIPKKWDESFSAFNTVVKESGFDLEQNKGKTVEKWLVLCPGRSAGDQKCYGVLLVYKQKPVGAYLLNEPSGEVLGLTTAAQTAAPLSEEEAQQASTEFGQEATEQAATEEVSAEVEGLDESAQQVDGDLSEDFAAEEVGAVPVE